MIAWAVDVLDLPPLMLEPAGALGSARAGDAGLPGDNRGDGGGDPKRESWSSSVCSSCLVLIVDDDLLGGCERLILSTMRSIKAPSGGLARE